ncbi:nicotinate-nucleotide--dimethylbenzimidazole phosphoribosyltransferase [Halorhodospira halophila]|uniref:Nicotinate-nucleotide--dimethylbenzimidazole phosphoribosyltransferase n=1 Tax=Halorhodospira halophila (strain DSM 244 / SL1) TaxID=349124 RepID=A1WY56_HALHL|nr:nicotinate-nucleotide--dimethylbenzimidazole phosphoribosyltransferase [Halorhodospira halophila]ABM62618.1 Nicotinate-nucleotide--dimethylbenzimidazole phosphoribosyltransferase [Halorhodospira halophila SL1]MBK1728298.1 nicotinate-nucleotide--dimethylbenzimidazole phosphoribosyltransferase [Halorhodospira halophila]
MNQPEWLDESIPEAHPQYAEQAQARQDQLTKPPGSLGRLEEIAIQLAGLQQTAHPVVDPVQITLFAGDHGIAKDGVSAFDPVVTLQMMENFSNGGAAICVMSEEIGAELEVVDVGTRWQGAVPRAVRDERIAPGTANMRRQPAMTDEQFGAALTSGARAVDRAIEKNGTRVFIAGEMGIANTTAAAAVVGALLNKAAPGLVGPGTGHDASGVRRKAQAVDDTLALHRDQLGGAAALAAPWEAGRRVGGLELAAMTGAYIRCAQRGVVIVLDGFISGAAALLAERLRPGCRGWMILGHNSAEPGHHRIVAALGGRPLLEFNMRLGEGSGAATAVPLMRMACAIHNRMATFAEAGVTPEGQG